MDSGTLTLIADGVAAACLTAGALLTLVAALGILRFPDVLTRMHSATKPQVLGLLLVLVGLGLLTGLLGLATGAHSGPEAEPVLLVVLSVLGLLLSVVVLFLLWRKESNAWFRGR